MAKLPLDYEAASAAAKADAERMLAALQTLPGGFGGPRLDDQNEQHQRCIKVYVGALAREEAAARPAVLTPWVPWVALDNLQNACDMAAGWLARVIKQTGGVPNGNV